ncbi:MAG: carboxymuconolactone decarboxylase family protein [Gemmataceae bacterium]|nr:carboxymuconolactone decarboxylase family protein [Gemmataceae bacterium]
MATLAMPQVDALREGFADAVRDLKVNLGNIASSDVLEADQIWGIALASAYYIGEPRLLSALLADAHAGGMSGNALEDARSAAGLMGMNTVYYRFRHLVDKDSYTQKPARLRMQAMVKPKTTKANFELFSLAIAALAGCETCIKAHEASVIQHGLGEDHVHEAVRIASILQGAAVALRTS